MNIFIKTCETQVQNLATCCKYFILLTIIHQVNLLFVSINDTPNFQLTTPISNGGLILAPPGHFAGSA